MPVQWLVHEIVQGDISDDSKPPFMTSSTPDDCFNDTSSKYQVPLLLSVWKAKVIVVMLLVGLNQFDTEV